MPPGTGAILQQSVTKYYAFNGQRVAMQKDGSFYYLHGDHLGSVVATTNRSGTLVGNNKPRYKGYGKEFLPSLAGLPTDYHFQGQKEDATGLLYFNARYFDPQTGSFISPDTVIPNPDDLFSYNRFMAFRGNPMKYTDPSGHCPMCVTAAFGAAIGGGFAYGWSVAANISNNGMSVDAFTSDVDWGSVGQGALVGGVVGLTGGLGTAYLGTSMGAGAVSGVMAGQAGVAASNLIGGETWNAGMGDPYQVAFDAATGAAGSLVSGKLARSSSASKSPIPGKGYQNEVTSTNPVRPKDAIDKWTQFLGDEPYTQRSLKLDKQSKNIE